MLINGTNLKMIRGDSESITLEIEHSDSTPYNFQTGDIVYFTVKQRTNTKEIILQKILTHFPDNQVIIEINPEDTSKLAFRKYVYDIQLTQADGRVKTVVPTSMFEILEEVTYD